MNGKLVQNFLDILRTRILLRFWCNHLFYYSFKFQLIFESGQMLKLIIPSEPQINLLFINISSRYKIGPWTRGAVSDCAWGGQLSLQPLTQYNSKHSIETKPTPSAMTPLSSFWLAQNHCYWCHRLVVYVLNVVKIKK